MNQVGRNRFCGERTAKSLALPENWCVINRYGPRQLILWNVAGRVEYNRG